MAVPYERRLDTAQRSYDGKGAAHTRKLRAVERLLDVLWRHTAPDSRLVHRFHLWQANDLEDVLHSIFLQSQQKNRRYRQSVLSLLSRTVQRSQVQVVRRWQLQVHQMRSVGWSEGRMRAAAKLVGVVVGRGMKVWGRRICPLYQRIQEDSLNSHFLLSLSFSLWASKSVSYLLYDSRREHGITRLSQVLFLHITNHLRSAWDQLRQKRGWNTGLWCVSNLMVRVKKRLMQEIWTQLKLRKMREMRQYSALKVVISAHKRSILYRKSWSRLKFLPQNRLISSIKSALSAFRAHHNSLKLKALHQWKSLQIPSNGFEVDMSIIRNQISVAELIERQIQTTSLRMSWEVRRIGLRDLGEAGKRGLREVIRRWRVRAGGIQEALLFEYVQYLEEQNGIVQNHEGPRSPIRC